MAIRSRSRHRADISIVVAPSLVKSSLPTSRAGLQRRVEI
jgi:hypothetical protein